MLYENNTKYKNINTNESMHSEMGPVWRKPNPENCKNCSFKCAYDCAQLQYTIQHRTVL